VRYSLVEEEQDIIEAVGEVPAKELRKLSSKHELVLMLHMNSIPPGEIAEITGYNRNHVTWITRQPISKAVIKARYEELDDEFKSLYYSAIEAIRDGLTSANIETKLKAADKYLRAHGKYGTVAEASETAEDVVKRILELKITETRPLKGD